MRGYVIPGNDDAIRAIRLVTSKISETILEARPVPEALSEGTLGEDGELLEEGGSIPFGAVEEELLRAFGTDEPAQPTAPAVAEPAVELEPMDEKDDIDELEEKV